ncbi:glycine dehydrogenase (aminomethyl-transferring) [Candidatus Desantisbacteria bacterium CG1_02_38_46]|uniref:glycine dehydrogenase (aminomethyl-transferring) n=2 Tax=unclassified Candidatus Desantisiibacteriota TaxID=3106372 RepID=A0A2H9PCU7_9BACT|nr:MAG: glycine dehydrogenase (aminomethyl-transferring) [Candidatus Desantisbacteria bacterium CG1_02_38_46]PIZ17194.1 MAG: glycine dehydrogenase (aminomethyl-transferring) [Candidatus Desantisbacteria bacterium CG_4_10_14_0_8_um_filter_39_17]
MKTIFEKSIRGRRAAKLPKSDVSCSEEIPEKFKRKEGVNLPEVAEIDVVRHYIHLSKKNFCVDANFYPLGSCTMKYNPKLGEEIARYEGFANLHPLLPQLHHGGMLTQGALEVIYNSERLFCKVTGMDEFSLQPLAGAHGELTGMLIVAAYHREKGNKKTKVLIPDSAHGTNPASAAIAGYKVVSIPSDKNGIMDIVEFKKSLDDEVAACMLTSPNTLGIFNPYVKEISELIHRIDGLMYYDGANLNALLGKCLPGDLGFDIVHLNLHKTFSTPHGGGGPGGGATGVCEKLRKFLPVSRVIKREDATYALDYEYSNSIGYIAPFYGNFLVILKAYAYILNLGGEGLKRVSENAVLNANYLLNKLKKCYEIPHPESCLHEFVISAKKQKQKGVSALDIAKRLIDFGFHPPTIYFPLIVEEAMMIEPTETESKETLDEFALAMIEIAKEVEENPDIIKESPQGLEISRLDEVKAAKELKLNG